MKKLFYFLAFTALLITSCSSEEKEIFEPIISETTITEITGSSALLSWDASINNGSNLSFDIILDNDQIAKDITTKSWEFKNLDEQTSYAGKVIAISKDGVTSEDFFNFTTNSHPTPTNVTIEVANITTSSATVSWSEANIDDNSTVLYDVYLNDELLKEDFTEHLIELNQLNPYKDYTIKVIAKSSEGKISNATEEFTTLGTAPTSFPLTIKNADDWDDLDPHWLQINWTPPTVEDGSSYSYIIYLNDEIAGIYIDNTTDSWTFTNLEEGKNYTVKIVADAYNETQTEETINFTTIIHPELSDFEITVDSFTSTSALISWTESTYPDNDDINYHVFLNGEQQTPALTPTYGLGYRFTNLSPNTSYQVKITANKTIGHPVKHLSKEINFTTDYENHPSLSVTEATLYTSNSTYFSNQLSVKFSNEITNVDIEKFNAGGITIGNFTTYNSSIISSSLSSENYQKILDSKKGYVHITDNGTTYRVDFNITEETN